MDKNKTKLLEIFSDDTFDLLSVKAKIYTSKNEDERLIDSFNEILEFYQINNREPEMESNIKETTLYYRLKGIRESYIKKDVLKKYDAFDLLEKTEDIVVETIDDIVKDDIFGILNSEADEIFVLKNVSKKTTMPDYVASRKPCKDFSDYEEIFKKCQVELSTGKRKLYPFKNEQQIEKGYFFVLKGILLYIANIGKKEIDKGKKNTRLRCIFENGTESDMLLRSLSAELYKNGRRVTESEDKLLDNFLHITDDDRITGYIYILKSKSIKPEINGIKNLYKIGYSTIVVEERIKNADQEPTYLMAAVNIIEVFKCYNMNTQKLELLLHNFFGKSCLNIDIYDKNGIRHSPREWFIAPIEVIEEAINLILNGEIINYIYNPNIEQIVLKN